MWTRKKCRKEARGRWLNQGKLRGRSHLVCYYIPRCGWLIVKGNGLSHFCSLLFLHWRTCRLIKSRSSYSYLHVQSGTTRFYTGNETSWSCQTETNLENIQTRAVVFIDLTGLARLTTKLQQQHMNTNTPQQKRTFRDIWHFTFSLSRWILPAS